MDWKPSIAAALSVMVTAAVLFVLRGLWEFFAGIPILILLGYLVYTAMARRQQ